MLTARLFAALAAVQIGLALLESRVPQASVDVYFHATYVVIGKNHLQILLAIANLCFALIYFVGSRSLTKRLSNTLGLVHFVLATIGFVSLTVALSGRIREAAPAEAQVRNAFVPIIVGVLCLLLGCATLAANCAWTMFMRIRAFGGGP